MYEENCAQSIQNQESLQKRIFRNDDLFVDIQGQREERPPQINYS